MVFDPDLQGETCRRNQTPKAALLESALARGQATAWKVNPRSPSAEALASQRGYADRAVQQLCNGKWMLHQL